MIFQGFMTNHILPKNAVIYAIPTHQMIHTNVGEKLFVGSLSPRKAVANVIKKRATEIDLIN